MTDPCCEQDFSVLAAQGDLESDLQIIAQQKADLKTEVAILTAEKAELKAKLECCCKKENDLKAALIRTRQFVALAKN